MPKIDEIYVFNEYFVDQKTVLFFVNPAPGAFNIRDYIFLFISKFH